MTQAEPSLVEGYSLLRQRIGGKYHFRLVDQDGQEFLNALITRSPRLPTVDLRNADGTTAGTVSRKRIGGHRLILEDPAGETIAAIHLPTLFNAASRSKFSVSSGDGEALFDLVPSSALEDRSKPWHALSDFDLVLMRDASPFAYAARSGDGDGGLSKRIGKHLADMIKQSFSREQAAPANVGEIVMGPGSAEILPPEFAMLVLLFRLFDYSDMRSIE